MRERIKIKDAGGRRKAMQGLESNDRKFKLELVEKEEHTGAF